ncbi:LamG-like jellyroll fold domain-containing protein [Flavobacterium sp.]|uniref:LamG-like jellyroll fold domain-containing protein n=1 Tax=Flavobacterium sp. TaxID=239 RepID=UPI0039189A75
MKNLLLKLEKNSILLLVLFTVTIGYGQNRTQTYTSSSSFTVPAGVTQVTVEAWGGGGKGGSRSNVNTAGGGGGGGAYAKKVVTVIPGNTYTVNVGVGSTTTITTTSSDSWFDTNTTILAKGGSSVGDNINAGAAGGSDTNSIGDVVRKGGKGSNGSSGNYGGGGGSSAGIGIVGNDATNATGATAPTGGGKGGNGATSNADAQNAGAINGAVSPGGGGGGARKDNGSTKYGGSGANGQIIISWDEPEINLTGNSVSIVDGDATPTTSDWTDFGSTDINIGSVTRTFTIENTETASLSIGTITIGGVNAADFTVTTLPSSSVAGGSSTTFVVTFNPSTNGLKSATVSIVNGDSDENPYNFSIQGNGFTTLTNGPGGVTSDLQLWLRADLINGTTNVSDNTAVNTWNTQALGTDAVKPTNVGAPVYRNNATHNLNFNAVVDFTNNYNTAPQVYTDNDGTRQYLKGTEGFYSNDMFVVLMPDTNVTSSLASMDIFCGDQIPGTQETDASGLGYGNYTARFTNELLAYGLGTSGKYGVGHISTSASYNSVGIINAYNNTANTGMQLNFNANNVANTEVNTATYGNVANSQYWIGRSEGWDGSLDGRIAEIITYSSRKNDASERNKIETYLAVKYGITLGVNGTSKDYVASNGTTIWSTSANTGFNYNIAGIGRDDASKLNQKQSKSSNANTVLTIGLTTIAATNTANTNTFDTDLKYLVWGDNGENMSDSGTDLSVTFGSSTVTTLTDLPNKKWKVVETGGDVGTVKVSLASADLLSLPALSGNDAYVMVVATNATFTTGVETVFLSTEGANQVASYDFDGTKYITFGVAHETILPRHISLDGSDDNVKIDAVNDLPGTFSMMVWVRPIGQNDAATDRTIVSKYNGTTGYKVYLGTDNKVNVSWIGGTTLTSSVALPNAVWHNIAVVYSSGDIKLYIDGVLDSTVTSAAPTASSNMFSIGGEYRNKTDIRNLFKGDIDELRMFSSALTLAEIRFIMNQEILQNSTGIKGTVMPTTITKNDISGLTWSSLYAYYTMNSYIGTHLNDDSANNNRGSLVIPDKITISVQTAPMPYESAANGLWSNTATWSNGDSQDLPSSLSIVDNAKTIDWNIVRTSHNVSSTGNKTLLGLAVESNTISAENDTKIEVSHYLKLNGKIDLVDKSQLVQTTDSDIEVTSSGSIERDQQGQSNTYNYNYWSSPVSTINNTTINHGYTVAGVMKDGTTTTPQNLNWSSGVDGAPTSPITLASYWIFKFQNYTNDYANWSAVGPDGSLLAGQGYTMKGSAALTGNQNYTFVGKPNNGTITSTVSPGNLNLCGNPFASAIDADQFIDDNVASITGTLYFWEHYNTNNSHNTVEYQGGYATYTKVGGTAPVAPTGVSGLGSSSKTAKRFIPVGQGFFVTGTATGGTITFNNNQRIFVKEDNTNSYSLYRSNAAPTVNNDANYNNSEDTFSEEQFMKLRLGYNSADNYHREILLGFMNENATAGFDNGYDALSIEALTNDMYFMQGETKLNIQGDGAFNVNTIYPLGVKNATQGMVKFAVNNKENFEENQDIFIYDNETQIYHDIKSEDFEISLPVGTFDTRFSLRFLNPTALGTDENVLQNGVAITHSQVDNMVNINNELQQVSIKSVALYNLLGQQVISWKLDDQNQSTMHLPISGVSAGGYIVKIATDKGDITKKILIK